MHGNVWEWCRDRFSDYSNGDATDPVGPSTGSFRVRRGGSWSGSAGLCRSANRSCDLPDYRNDYLGFRLVLVPKQNNPQLSDLFNEIMSQMIACSAGSFMMGSQGGFLGFGGELGRSDNELQHRVTISSDFKICKYPVTQKLYEVVMGNNPSYFKGENNPVECVSWNDAKAFCDKLNHKFASKLPKGYRFDLPTEAQWEYACRAGITSALNNGKDLTSKIRSCSNLDEVAWYRDNSGNKTHPVGKKKPNAWGIYDMHGNVCEWCRDWYGDYPKGNVIDPVGPSTGLRRVVRGGSYDVYAVGCRSAHRYHYEPDYGHTIYRLSGVGFRLALVPIE